MSEPVDLATAIEQRDRARATLDKIRGIVVALHKRVGTASSAIAAITAILHVKYELVPARDLSDLGERIKRLAIRYADKRVDAEIAYERDSSKRAKYDAVERHAWLELLTALKDVKDPPAAPAPNGDQT
jgi:hypothetical protein